LRSDDRGDIAGAARPRALLSASDVEAAAEALFGSVGPRAFAFAVGDPADDDGREAAVAAAAGRIGRARRAGCDREGRLDGGASGSDVPATSVPATCVQTTPFRVTRCKSIALMAHGVSPAVVVAEEKSRVDMKWAADALGVPKRRLRLATAAQCADVFGFAPGTVPAFGHRTRCPTLLAPELRGLLAEAVGCGSATASAELHLFSVGGGASDVTCLLTPEALAAVAHGSQLGAKASVKTSAKASNLPSRLVEPASETIDGRTEARPASDASLRAAPTTDAAPTADAADGGGWRRPGAWGKVGERRFPEGLPITGLHPIWVPPADGDGRPGGLPLRFAVSEELLRLARHLRVLGVDAATSASLDVARRGAASGPRRGGPQSETSPVGAGSTIDGPSRGKRGGLRVGRSSTTGFMAPTQTVGAVPRPPLSYAEVYRGAAEGRSDAQLLQAAVADGRILLTRDRKLAARRRPDGLALLLLRSESVQTQLAAVCTHFAVPFDRSRFMSRCSLCNTPGFEGPMTVRQIEAVAPGVVPPKVKERVEEYFCCLNDKCRKVYWRGPKYDTARKQFRAQLEGSCTEEAVGSEAEDVVNRTGRFPSLDPRKGCANDSVLTDHGSEKRVVL
jgi:uncharacterized protein with PIN domain